MYFMKISNDFRVKRYVNHELKVDVFNHYTKITFYLLKEIKETTDNVKNSTCSQKASELKIDGHLSFFLHFFGRCSVTCQDSVHT